VEAGDAQFRGALHDGAHGADSHAVPLDAGKSPQFRPPAVAVHDDGDVPRQGGVSRPKLVIGMGRKRRPHGQTSRISCSFDLRISSTFFTWAFRSPSGSVSCRASRRPRRSPSSSPGLELSRSPPADVAHRDPRVLGHLRTIFASSLRRSSVREDGDADHLSVARRGSARGRSPGSPFRSARPSSCPRGDRDQAASGTERVPTCWSGVGCRN